MRKYLVVYEKSKTGFAAYVPDLPGCIATGATKKQTEKKIYEAIQFHIEGLKLEGLPIPKNYAESEIMMIAVN